MVFSSSGISLLAIFKINVLNNGDATRIQGAYASMKKIVWLSLRHLN